MGSPLHFARAPHPTPAQVRLRARLPSLSPSLSPSLALTADPNPSRSPTPSQVASAHAEYVASLTALFERHKVRATARTRARARARTRARVDARARARASGRTSFLLSSPDPNPHDTRPKLTGGRHLADSASSCGEIVARYDHGWQDCGKTALRWLLPSPSSQSNYILTMCVCV